MTPATGPAGAAGAVATEEAGSDPRLATGLTAAEAAARGSVIESVGYRVQVDLSAFAANGTFSTTTEIDFDCTRPGTPLWLDLIADRVLSVRHNGSELDSASVRGPERLLIPDPAARNTVAVTSVHTAGTAAAGLCRTVDAADGAVYAWTQFQPFDARRMFACFDQPDLRGVIRLEVTAPAEWTCLSTTSPAPPPPPESCGPAGAGPRAGPHDSAGCGRVRRTVFAPTPPIPVYLVVLCAGPFASVMGRHGGVTLGLHARASLAADLRVAAPDLFALTAHGLDAFSGAFGVPYPLGSYHQVFLPDQPGAMENLGCITWNDAVLYRSEPSVAQRVRRALVLLHELSHQWFGDLVTPRWWDDLWLSESFADWAAVWALRSFAPLAGGSTRGHATHLATALRADRLPSTHPVSRAVPDMQAVAANFDAITYAKGACLLAQLVDLIGEDAFLAGLRGYLARHAWGSVGIDALLGELDRATEVDVSQWATQWLRSAGVNTVRVHRGSGGAVLVQTADRVAPPPNPTGAGAVLRRHRLRIGRYRSTEAGLVAVGEIWAQVHGARTPLVPAPPRHEVLLPGDGLGAYLACRPDPSSLRALLDHGNTLTAPGSRDTVRNLVSDMVFTADLDGPAAVTALAAMVITEPHDAALVSTIDQAVEAAGGFTAHDRRTAAFSVLCAACREVAARATVGSPHWLAGWQGVARSAVTPEQTDALAGLLAGTDAPQALRWQALTRLVALGAVGEAQIAAERARDPDPDADRSATVARAAVGSVHAKRTALDALLSTDAVPIGALPMLAVALWQPHQHELLAPLVDELLDRLPGALEAGGPARAMRLARWCLPEYPLGAGVVARVWELAADDVLPDVARSALADQAALAERRSRAAAL